MFKKILIPLDDTQCSKQAAETALRLAQEWAKRWETKVVLLHVMEPDIIYIYESSSNNPFQEQASKMLEPWVHLARTLDVTVEMELISRSDQSVAQSIVDSAKAHHCDLILMGTHGYEGMARVLMGSVAERVSQLTDLPVLLLHQGLEVNSVALERILVPTDGSDTAEHALHQAAKMANDLGAQLEILHIVPEVPLLYSDFGSINYTEWQETLDLQGEKMLEALKIRFPAAVITCKKAQNMSLAQAILEQASKNHSQLIVMGTHGRRGLERLMLGSVAEAVLHHARIPVMLCHQQ
jgi:nucleotide-binding universal stress UspA family protein